MSLNTLRTCQKVWHLSGSLGAFRKLYRLNDHTSHTSVTGRIEELAIRHRGTRFVVQMRDGTSDLYILKEVFLNGCYRLPSEVTLGEDATIIDIGANIGLATLYLHAAFPAATIHAFEPMPENYAVLQANTSRYPRVHIHNMVVSDRDGYVPFAAVSGDANLGGGGIHPDGTMRMPSTRLETFCETHNVKAIDAIKIDCEGGEYEILFGMAPAVLSTVKLVVGEAHGPKAWSLLEYLSAWFDIGLSKDPKHLNFTFTAVNRAVMIDRYGERPQPLADWYEGRPSPGARTR